MKIQDSVNICPINILSLFLNLFLQNHFFLFSNNLSLSLPFFVTFLFFEFCFFTQKQKNVNFTRFLFRLLDRKLFSSFFVAFSLSFSLSLSYTKYRTCLYFSLSLSTQYSYIKSPNIYECDCNLILYYIFSQPVSFLFLFLFLSFIKYFFFSNCTKNNENKKLPLKI